MIMRKSKKVYIIILNWNGWKDTIECLESVMRNAYQNYKVIVCDNNSTDGSLEKIKQWAAGNLQANVSNDERISRYTSPSLKKPIQYIEYQREQAEKGGLLNMEEPPLILIQTDANLGFAGGNNVGMRYILARDDFEYIWLLNNDTVIKCDALINLLKEIQEKPSTGMCGSTLLYYHEPDKVQALGGAIYNKWLGIIKHIGAFMDYTEQTNTQMQMIERKMDYIIGASMFVSKAFLNDIGLMSEEYFLYYEEIDWAMRAKGRYTLSYAPCSVVYHKEGASIGANGKMQERRSWIADYYGIKNRLVFTKKFFWYALPTIYVGLLIAIFNRIRYKQWDRIYMILKIAFKF